MIFILTAIIVILDQISKLAAIKYLKGNSAYVIIENFLQFTYVENYGAAFGILQNKRTLFIIITLIVVFGLTIFLAKSYHYVTFTGRIALALFLGGAIGNFIDRIRLGYVVDFISVRLLNKYDFPVFNIADIFIVIGTILIVILVLFDKYEA